MLLTRDVLMEVKVRQCVPTRKVHAQPSFGRDPVPDQGADARAVAQVPPVHLGAHRFQLVQPHPRHPRKVMVLHVPQLVEVQPLPQLGAAVGHRRLPFPAAAAALT